MSTKPTNTIITPPELLAAPMESAHKDLVLRHYYRLIEILHKADTAAIGNYTNKQAAREQLARMTLIIRDYLRLSSRDDDTIESMVADVVDASLFVGGTQQRFSQPVFMNSQLWGRELEIAALMQEFDAEGADDVMELWNIVADKHSNKIAPDSTGKENLGKDVDWNDVLCRSRSENNLLWHREEWEVEDKGQWERDLKGRELEELDLVWPPKFRDPEPNLGRQRRRGSTIQGRRI